MKEQNKSQVWIGAADMTNDPEFFQSANIVINSLIIKN